MNIEVLNENTQYLVRKINKGYTTIYRTEAFAVLQDRFDWGKHGYDMTFDLSELSAAEASAITGRNVTYFSKDGGRARWEVQ
jgi:hypothetical protein